MCVSLRPLRGKGGREGKKKCQVNKFVVVDALQYSVRLLYRDVGCLGSSLLLEFFTRGVQTARRARYRESGKSHFMLKVVCMYIFIVSCNRRSRSRDSPNIYTSNSVINIHRYHKINTDIHIHDQHLVN